MVDPQLLNYIKGQKESGINDNQLKSILIANGWPQSSIDEALSSLMMSTPLTVKKSSNFANIWKAFLIIIVTLCIVVGGGLAINKFLEKEEVTENAFTNRNVVEQTIPNFTETIETKLITASTSVSTSTVATVCTSFSCLMSAVEMCEPIKAEISFKNLFFPVVPGVDLSGRNSYEVAKSLDSSKCKFTMVFLDWKFVASDSYVKESLSKGVTQSEIDSQIQMVNKSFSFYRNVPITCDATSSWLVGFVADMRDGAFNYDDINFLGARNSSTTIDVLVSSGGQNMTCFVQLN